MKPTETKLDLVVKRIKDHRLMMWFLLVGLALIGFGHVSDALAKVAAIVKLTGAYSANKDDKPENARRQLEKAKIPYTREQFLKATSSGEYESVRLLLEAGMDPNFVLQDSSTALLKATSKGHADLVRLLLEAGAEVDRPEEHGITPLMLAAMRGNEDIIRLLMSHGASISRRDKDGHLTPLIYAAAGCSPSAVEILLRAQADANDREENGATALMYAVEVCDKPENENTQQKIIMLLVAGGADLEAKDDDGQTALDYARDQPAIETLLEALVGRRNRVETTQNQTPAPDG